MLDCIIKHKVFADIFKAALMEVELDNIDPLKFNKWSWAMQVWLPKPTEWAGTAAILAMMVDAVEKEKKKLFAKTKFEESSANQTLDDIIRKEASLPDPYSCWLFILLPQGDDTTAKGLA